MNVVDIPRITDDNFGKMVSLHYRHSLGDEHDYAENEHVLFEVVEKDVSQEIVIEYVLKEAPRTSFEQKDNQCVVSFFDDEKEVWYDDFIFEGTLEENKSKVVSGMLQSLLDDDLEKLATKHTALLPLCVYENDMLVMNTTGFDSQFDMGQMGYIFASNEDVKNLFGEVTAETLEKARDVLREEVESYSEYLQVATSIIQSEATQQSNRDDFEDMEDCR